MRKRRIVLSSVASLAVLHLSTLSHKRHDFQKKKWNLKCVFWFYVQISSETFLILSRIRRDIVVNVRTSSRKSPLFLSVFNHTWIFSTDFRKILKFHENPSVGAELFHADGQTGRYEKANSRCSYLSERALKFAVKRGLPVITVSHYIICANNRWPLQYVTQTWHCTVHLATGWTVCPHR
jgi:hypothetical protein